MSNKAKKPWTKKKKIKVALLSIFIFLVVLITGGLIAGYNFWYKTVDYQVVSAADMVDENTKMIAHRGFRAAAPENTLPAFEKAGEANYWGAECDIYRTTDGVWVVHHDPISLRMMDKLGFIEKHTYDELMEYNYDNGVNIDQYENLKICTFDEYLKACQDYNMHCVIELKGENNLEYYGEIYDTIAKYDVDYTFISFHEEDLKALREINADAPMFYLCDIVDEEAIQIAEGIGNCGIDFNAGKKKNFEDGAQGIKLAQEHGLVMGAWTIDDPEVMKQCLDLGIEYITTNAITY